uniref:Uncharacterized protein n=1 Tax=Tectiviridae sp. TaxID=2831614 RepID=A0A8S5VY96_9VIRU|nr:MAG TPA: hypothetical protein [Tectiviridae sp.]
MDGKFLGLGLKNIIGLYFILMLISLLLKTVFTKYEVEGLSEIVRTAG